MPRIYLSPPDIRTEDHAALDAVLTSNWVAPAGPHLKRFEETLAKQAGRTHAFAANSGTAALHLALKVLNIQAGDSVVCPTFTFAASANPIRYCGAEPIFVDSEPNTWNLDSELLQSALEERAVSGNLPKAVIVVHLYGQCADMDPIEKICRDYDIPIIEDAAEALGAHYKGRPAGGMGALSFFSFNGNKIVTTSGGGMLLTNNAAWIEQARYLATQAREPTAHYEHTEVGYNYRLSNVLAALGLSQLADLNRRIRIRREHFEFYRETLADLPGIAFMPINDPDSVNYWLTCLTVDSAISGTSRDQIIRALADADIEARPLWKPLHLQPVFKEFTVIGGKCAESLFTNGLCLPSGSSMQPKERSRVVEVVRSCFPR
ncbi:MAG: pyridoxal phosphate-dependent aminotransferase EpsN [Lentimonas sp.]|jgi:pyridoxal phosphate-dependent aminotransferase EpsN